MNPSKRIQILLLAGFLLLLQGCLIGLPGEQPVGFPPVSAGDSVEVDASDTGSETGELRLRWSSLQHCDSEEALLQIKVRRLSEGKWRLSRQERARCSHGSWEVLSVKAGKVQIEVKDLANPTSPPLLLQTETVVAGKVTSVAF